MTFIKHFKQGLIKYKEAIEFIIENKLTWFFIFPLILNIILFSLGWSSMDILSNYAREYIDSISQINNTDFWVYDILQKAIDVITWIFFKILFIIVFAYTGGYIVLIVLSPVLSYLSEQTEKIKTGKQYSFDIVTILNDTITGIYIALRNFSYELLITIVLLVFSFLPIIGLFSFILLIIVSSYFYGFSFLYYSIERKQLGRKANIEFMRKHKMVLVSNGLIFALCTMIPFIGIILSSFMAIISIVAASLSVHEISSEDTSLTHHNKQH